MLDPDEVQALNDQPKNVVLDAVKSCFMEIIIQLTQVGDEGAPKDYIKWLKESVQHTKSELFLSVKKSKQLYETHHQTLVAIRDDIKSLLPSSDSKDEPILFDQFLYDCVSEAQQAQNLSSLYKCTECGSRNIIPRQLISHSASVESLIQLFSLNLPDLSNLKLLDIGCGLGSILFGAYYFSTATICGIELNSKFCEILDTIIKKYNLQDRMSIVNGDVRELASLLRSSDIVTFNNVLEYFVPINIQKEIWQFLCDNLKTDSLFVTNPDLPTLLRPLNLVDIMDGWVLLLEPKIDKSLLKGFPDTDETFFIYKVVKVSKPDV